MIGLDLSQGAQAVIALLILCGMFVMFLRETYPVEVVALGLDCHRTDNCLLELRRSVVRRSQHTAQVDRVLIAKTQ